MASSVEAFEIPVVDLFGDDYDGCTENRVKGLVIHVEKCTNPDHDNWIHLHSTDKSEYVSETHTEISTGTDLITSVGGNRLETVSGNITASISGNRADTIGGNSISSVGGDRTEEVSGNYLVTAEKIDLNSELVQIKKLAVAPAALGECIADGKYDLCRVVAWFENWSSEMNSRLSGLEQRVAALEPPA